MARIPPPQSVPLTIEEVLREIVVAVFANALARDLVVLKGGAALQLAEGVQSRLSTDVDFSSTVATPVSSKTYHPIMDAVKLHFAGLGYDVIDARIARKPARKKKGTPKFWGGWAIVFKLSGVESRHLTKPERSRRAYRPQGVGSPSLEIDISDHEYVGDAVQINLMGVSVRAYSTTLLILEKLRAICQQHPSYVLTSARNRARDYYDIYQLLRKTRGPESIAEELWKHCRPVFDAKNVPIELLDAIFDEAFVDEQRDSFAQVEATVSGDLQPFDFYLEWVRRLCAVINAGL